MSWTDLNRIILKLFDRKDSEVFRAPVPYVSVKLEVHNNINITYI